MGVGIGKPRHNQIPFYINLPVPNPCPITASAIFITFQLIPVPHIHNPVSLNPHLSPVNSHVSIHCKHSCIIKPNPHNFHHSFPGHKQVVKVLSNSFTLSPSYKTVSVQTNRLTAFPYRKSLPKPAETGYTGKRTSAKAM